MAQPPITPTGTAKRVQVRDTVDDTNWNIIYDTGSLSGTTPSPPSPAALQAVINAPATAVSGTTVILDGSKSTGPISSYSWFQPRGTTVTLSANNTPTVTYTVPPSSAAESEVFTLTVTDATGKASSVDATVQTSLVPPPTPTPTPTPTPGTDVDKFGYQKIYADRQGTYNNWIQTTANDPRFFEGRVADSGGGWLKAAGGSTEIRIEVLSDTSANENTIPTFDVGKVISKGYLYKPIDSSDGKGDFGDFEMTWRIRGKAGTGTKNGECHAELVPGGYRQTSDMNKAGKDKAVPAACEAMSYHFNLYPLTGRVKFEKDSMHTNGYTKSDPEKKNAISKFDNMQEIIQKAILYRTAKGVKLESYVDTSGTGKQFKKVIEFEDTGQWGPTRGDNSACHCGQYPILSMGRVALGYRGDNWNSFEFKDASIRSINSGQALHAATTQHASHDNMIDEDIERT